MKSGLEIAQAASMERIADVAAAAGILPEELRPYGTYRAKVALSILDRLREGPDGKLVITSDPDQGRGRQDDDVHLAHAGPGRSREEGGARAAGNRRWARCSD